MDKLSDVALLLELLSELSSDSLLLSVSEESELLESCAPAGICAIMCAYKSCKVTDQALQSGQIKSFGGTTAERPAKALPRRVPHLPELMRRLTWARAPSKHVNVR